jgi:hypothetical protein
LHLCLGSKGVTYYDIDASAKHGTSKPFTKVAGSCSFGRVPFASNFYESGHSEVGIVGVAIYENFADGVAIAARQAAD